MIARGLDHRRAALGRRQDHRDAGAAGGAAAARPGGAGGQSRARLYRPGLPCSRDRARRASISTAGRCRRRWSMRWSRSTPRMPICWSSKARWACSTACRRRRVRHRGHGRPRRAARSAGAAGDRRRRPVAIGGGGGCAASPRTIADVRDRRRGAEPRRQRAACAARGRRHRARSTFPCSARSRATHRSRCPSAISAWCRPASTADLAARLERLADMAERHLDLDAIQAMAVPLAPFDRTAVSAPVPPPGQRIALARDAAFSFVYPHVLDGWQRAGAEIVPFSPLADEAPPEDCDSLLAARRLSRAARRPARRGRAVSRRPRAFADDAAGAWRVRRLHGARREPRRRRRRQPPHGRAARPCDQLRASASCISAIARRGCSPTVRSARPALSLRGHEFHYAALIAPGNDAPLAELADSQGERLGHVGGRRGHVTGTFFHAIAKA